MRPRVPNHWSSNVPAFAMLVSTLATTTPPAARGSAVPAPACRAVASHDAATLLAAASRAMGVDRVDTLILRSTIYEMASDRLQADRMYPPYPFRSPSAGSPLYVAWSSGVVARPSPQPPGLASAGTTLAQRNNDRPMDPWIVLADWTRSGAPVRAAEECFYRDYWRTVLSRVSPTGGAERLFIDTKSGFPVKLERREPYSIFGDALMEYLWTNWLRVGPAAAPRIAFQLVDGVTERQWSHTKYALVPADSLLAPMPLPGAPGIQSIADQPTDTIRIDSVTFMLASRFYYNIVTLQRDTVFVLDAQMGEDRARGDSTWIAKLFPGRHPFVLVVTDLAWPHIAGVRYWVARGATVWVHDASRAFLTEVIDRHWTLKPDVLEKRRALVRPHIKSVTGSMSLAAGRIELRLIDGIGSEGALMAYFPVNHFLYAGDYIQPGDTGPAVPVFFAATYMDEVAAAVQRNGFTPGSFAGMHVKPAPWSLVASATKH